MNLVSRLVQTGSPALDDVLGGGLPVASSTLVAGLPGTGKTVLATQFLFANASFNTPGLYLTTLSEPLDKAVRYMQEFTFFDPDLIPGAIHYQDVGQPIRDRGIAALPALIEELIAHHQAAFLVIDSFKALHDLTADPVAFRIAVFDVARVLAQTGVTALLVGEYGPTEIGMLPEFAVVDGVIEMANRNHGVRDERTLRVSKLRGAANLSGEHSFRIDATGLHVFPRLVGTDRRLTDLPSERVRIGVPGLDSRLHGGVWRGGSTIVAGPSGVGKTMLGLRFLLTGIEAGEPGVMVTFQESPAHLRRVLAGFGADLDALERRGALKVVYVPPLELDLVELFGQIRMDLEQGGARRLVVDALGDLQDAALDRSRFRAMVWSLTQYLVLVGVTGFFLVETPMGGAITFSPSHSDISYVADAVIVLRYLRAPTDEVDRTIDIVKTRASGHVSGPLPFRMGPAGPELMPDRVES